MRLVFLILLSAGISAAYVEPARQWWLDMQDIYTKVRQWFADDKKLDVFGHKCRWTRQAGFYQWYWVYDGEIDCPSLGKTYKKTVCYNKPCAFKEPYKMLLKDLLAKGRVSKEIFRNAEEEFEVFDEDERQELRALAD